MLPAEWGDVGEQLIRHVDTRAAQVLDGAVEINRVPQRHRGRDQSQPQRPVPLVLERAIAQFAFRTLKLCRSRRYQFIGWPEEFVVNPVGCNTGQGQSDYKGT